MPVAVGMGLRSTWIGEWSIAATARPGEATARPFLAGACVRPARADALNSCFLTGFI